MDAWSRCALVRAWVTPGPCGGIFWAALSLRKDGGNLSTENRERWKVLASSILFVSIWLFLPLKIRTNIAFCKQWDHLSLLSNPLSTSTSTQVHQKCEHSSLKLCTKAFSWSHKCIMARRPLLLQAYLRSRWWWWSCSSSSWPIQPVHVCTFWAEHLKISFDLVAICIGTGSEVCAQKVHVIRRSQISTGLKNVFKPDWSTKQEKTWKHFLKQALFQRKVNWKHCFSINLATAVRTDDGAKWDFFWSLFSPRSSWWP